MAYSEAGTGSAGQARWTDEQSRAIVERLPAVLVGAAAGSGKTSVLVERVVRRVCDPDAPADVDRLLVVTFTEAAAAEMRVRIERSLAETAAARPGDRRLHRQMALLGRASISTLHAFCLRAVRQNFHRVGLDPGVQVPVEQERLLLEDEVLAELLEGCYERGSSTFLGLVDGYGEDAVRDAVLRLHRTAFSQPWPDRWLDAAASRFESIDAWIEPLRRAGRWRVEGAAAELERAGLPADALRLRGIPWDAGWDAIRTGLEAADTWAVARGLDDGVKRLRDQAKETVRDLARNVFRPSEQLREELRGLRPLARELADLVQRFDAAFTGAKAERGWIDFADMERLTLRLLLDPSAPPGQLRPSAAAREIGARFDECLVDEYQDINEVQDAILRLLGAGCPALFMVGDVKQSIYRFRQAEPGLFLRRRQEGARDGGVLELTHNFRSRRSVLDACNFVFRQLFVPGVGGMAYGAADALVPGSGETASWDGDAPVELHLVERGGGTRDPADASEGGETAGGAPDGHPAGGAAAEEEDSTPLEREASAVGRRIRELVGSTNVRDPETGRARPARYRDVVVLLRAAQRQAPVFVDVLSRQGVPVYARTRGGYFRAVEVEALLSLLAVVDNPYQDIPLAAALRSPLVGLSAAELAAVRLAAPGEPFCAAVRAAAESPGTGEEPVGHGGASSLRARLRRFLADLDRWRTAARRGPLSVLVARIYAETGFLAYAGGMPGGEQRRANLLALQDRARQFDGFARQGLFRFLRFVERLRESGEDMATAPALGENEDVVRVMTIHQSKGLEFPIVVLANLGGRFRDESGDLPLDREFGLGPRVADLERRVKYPSLAYHAVREQSRLGQLAEEVRILYVGFTRARDRLLLFGSVGDPEGALARWNAAAAMNGPRLPEAEVAGARCYLDWLGPALARHPAGWPDGGEGDLAAAGEPSRWRLRLWRGDATPSAGEPAAAGGDAAAWARIEAGLPLDRPPASAAAAAVVERVRWAYPYRALADHVAKRSVTEVKHLVADPERAAAPGIEDLRRGLPARPRFVRGPEGPGRAAARGTAVHAVLQLLDLGRSLDESDVGRQVGGLIERDAITREQAALVDPETLARFFASPLGRRLHGAPHRVRREWAFTLRLPLLRVHPEAVERLPPGAAGEESVMLQGTVDCLLEEAAGFLLLDFKTDRVGPRSVEELAAGYRGQVELYREAVETIEGRPVSEAHLVFLDAGRAVRVG